MAGFYTPNSDWLPLRARDWSPGTRPRSIIGGSPRSGCQADIPAHPDKDRAILLDLVYPKEGNKKGVTRV